MKKQTLILLPGVGCNQVFWEHQIKHLSDVVDVKVILLDQQDNREHMILRVLDSAPERFSLAGHSLGGWVAQEVAAQAPHRIDKLFLMSTWAKATPEFWFAIHDWIARIRMGELESILDNEILPFVFPAERLGDTALIAQHQKMKKSIGAEIYLWQLSAMAKNPDTFSLLHKIQAPTLLIHGRQDRNFSIAEQETMKREIPHAKLAIIEDCGHMTAMERPQAVTALMRSWLEGE